MPQQDIHSVNHVGIVVRDLAETTRRYHDLGFTLTPFSAHSGAWKPGEAATPLGSGNHCIMFAHNYLEILGSANPADPSPRLERYLQHHQGGHIICFGAEHLQTVEQRLLANRIDTSGVLPLQRDVDTPEGPRTAKFERIQFSPADSPEGYIQAARHLTPEFIYQARYLQHPNGCQALSSTLLIVDDLAGFQARYQHYTGIEAKAENGEATFHFPLCSTLTLLTPQRALQRLPGSLHPPIPGIAAVGFRCPDLKQQAERLDANRIPFTRLDGQLIVPAEAAAGIAVIFET
ncbi:MAG: VOC family protein [Pigmentiphaga sp.]|nr:VOC family protein [Pigmentiphaga sp.]